MTGALSGGQTSSPLLFILPRLHFIQHSQDRSPAPGQSTSKETGKLVNGYGMPGMCTCFIYCFPCVNTSLINTVEKNCFLESQHFSLESLAAASQLCRLLCAQHSCLVSLVGLVPGSASSPLQRNALMPKKFLKACSLIP